MTQAFVLLGNPVAHSVSPAIHAAGFAASGIDATYSVRAVDVTGFAAVFRRVAAAGGGNVTLPHKTAAAGLLDRATPAVEATGACNCFWDAGREGVAGDNTDVGGFAAAVADLGLELAGARVFLVGAGGAARAVARAASVAGARLEIANRDGSRARALAERFGGGSGTVAAVDAPRGSYDLAVNATRLGLEPGDPLAMDPESVRAAAVLDLVYAPGETPLVHAFRRRGVPAADGLGMLIHQAALSFARWFPGVDPPLDAMRAAGCRALGRATPGGGP